MPATGLDMFTPRRWPGLVRALASAVALATVASCASERSAPEPEAVPGGPVASDTAGAVPEQAPAVEPGEELLTPDGWGPLRIGMTRAEVVAAAGEDANPDAVGGPDPDRCDQFRPSRAPAGLLVMVEDGILTRISVSRNPDITTPEGVAVGDPGSRIREPYGARGREEPHRYWPSPAKYITVWRADGTDAERRGIRYEIDADGLVVHLHAGGPSIEYVEGCL